MKLNYTVLHLDLTIPPLYWLCRKEIPVVRLNAVHVAGRYKMLRVRIRDNGVSIVLNNWYAPLKEYSYWLN